MRVDDDDVKSNAKEDMLQITEPTKRYFGGAKKRESKQLDGEKKDSLEKHNQRKYEGRT